MATNESEQQRLENEIMADPNTKATIACIGKEARKQMAAALKDTMPRLLESALIVYENKRAKSPEYLRQGILDQANLIFDMWAGRTASHSRPTILVTGFDNYPRDARVVGTKTDAFGKVSFITYVRTPLIKSMGSVTDTDVIALHDLYREMKCRLMRALVLCDKNAPYNTFENWEDLAGEDASSAVGPEGPEN
ncbi:hypothetical protein Q7P37_005344 [Cladosporium fusiforme]